MRYLRRLFPGAPAPVDGGCLLCHHPALGMSAAGPRIHLDHNAGTPVRPEVREALRRFCESAPGNPSSTHAAGREARRMLDEARETVAGFLRARPSEIVFTSGGTESAHLAWRAFQRNGCRIATSGVEHHCVLDAARAAERAGAEIVRAEADRTGALRLAPLFERLRGGVDFVSIQYANNETGAVHPLPEIARRAKDAGGTVHSDAVQAAGKIPVHVRELGVDLLSISGHKLGALSGVGALYAKEGAPIEPIWAGGTQEGGLRTGTENLAGIVSLAAACGALLDRGEEERRAVRALRDGLEEGLRNRIPGFEITGAGQPRLPNTSHLVFDGLDGESLAIAADLAGIHCSTGAACASGSLRASHVLLSMGLSPERARGSIRISLGWNSTEYDINQALEILPKLVARVRREGKKFLRRAVP